MKSLLIACATVILLLSPVLSPGLFTKTAQAQEEYTFDLSEIEKKPYHFGGYIELRPALSGLKKESSFYKIKFYHDQQDSHLEEYNLKLQLEASYEWEDQ